VFSKLDGFQRIVTVGASIDLPEPLGSMSQLGHDVRLPLAAR
jgi:hypothetical protein